MSRGGDGNAELGVARIQMRASAERLAKPGGLGDQVKANNDELRDRVAGALFGSLLIVGLASTLTDYAAPIITVCAAIGLASGALRWRRRLSLNQKREMQIRQTATTVPEKTNA